MRASARLSQCGTYRWTLERRWGDGAQVCWIMLNPSTADHAKDDPTIRRCIRFSQAWGYGSLVVVNLFPFRSSSPRECKAWADYEKNGPDWYARDAMVQNFGIAAEVASAAALIVAAWGAADWAYPAADLVLDEIDHAQPIMCLGKSANGSPLHPLARGKAFIPYDVTLQPLQP